MAGGSGTRLWPASNSLRPKQFLQVDGEHTFFDGALERALAVTNKPDGRVIIIAGKGHVDHVFKASQKLSAEYRKRIVLIPEPEAKNTTAAIACGIVYAERTSGTNRDIIVLTSDHIITPLDAFIADAAEAYKQRESLIVFGIQPRSPDTGYGYIEAAEALSSQLKLFKVMSFREKPDKQKAEQFIAQGNFYWNSGMFAFSTQFMMEEFNRSAPKLIAGFCALAAPEKSSYVNKEGILALENWSGLEKAYSQAENISFDYAIVEKCTRTVVVVAGFNWLDIGSWDEYVNMLGDTGSEVYSSGGNSCFVDSDIPVALCGVEDLIVVVHSGKDTAVPAVLIAKKGETQKVREIVEKIKDAGKTQLL
jgi:mannose-1-phosphate guanylyltransferase/mannose-6-phosphate isomerase